METLEEFYERNRERYERASQDVERTLKRAVADSAKLGRRRTPSVSARPTGVKSKARFLSKARRERATAHTVTSLVRDLAGVRVTCKCKQDVDEVLGIIRQLRGVRFVDIQDHAVHGTDAGYRALHVTVETEVTKGTAPVPVECEVQVMTLLQNAWAEFGHEDLYEREDAPPRLVQLAKRVAELLAVADGILQDIREELEAPSQVLEAPAEEGRPGLSEYEVSTFFEQMTGRRLTVAELPEATEVLNAHESGATGTLDRDLWLRAGNSTASLYSQTLHAPRPPDAFDTLVYGVPLARGADLREVAVRAADDYGLTVCPRCGRATWERRSATHMNGPGGGRCSYCGHTESSRDCPGP
jgi:ppGpp synthetase/RelA/SpoT-type nucleotidyltranferase